MANNSLAHPNKRVPASFARGFCFLLTGFLLRSDGVLAPFGQGTNAVRTLFLLCSDGVLAPFGGGSSAVLAGAKDGAGNLLGIRKTPCGPTQNTFWAYAKSYISLRKIMGDVFA